MQYNSMQVLNIFTFTFMARFASRPLFKLLVLIGTPAFARCILLTRELNMIDLL